MKRARRSQIFWRNQGGVNRAYADLRSYADVGGRKEALVPPGEKLGTADRTTAQVLLARRLEQLEAARRNRALHGFTADVTLASYARTHLLAKARAGRVTEQWLATTEKCLNRAIDFFGTDRDLAAITVREVRNFAAHLLTLPNGRGGTMSGGNVRHHLNCISNLYRRARADHIVPSGYNPVADFDEKPTAARNEAKWLEMPDAALLLEAARIFQGLPPQTGRRPVPFIYPLIATFLLTGGRHSEVVGLEVDDLSFDRRTITFRPNVWRRLKTATSFRSVPMWPQLEEILREYVFGAGRPPGRLLFPSYRKGAESIITDFRKALDAVAVHAGWQPGEIRSKMFRHTYCAARLQTLDGGAPVSAYTVGKELGHGGDAMIRRVYGHLGQLRHRADVVEYRLEAWADKLAVRLEALR